MSSQFAITYLSKYKNIFYSIAVCTSVFIFSQSYSKCVRPVHPLCILHI